MQPLTALRTLALASMLAFSIIGVPSVRVHAQPNNGVPDGVKLSNCGPSKWVPGKMECSDQFGNTYVCNSSDGTTPDVDTCVLFTQTALTGPGSGPTTVHPVIGGLINTGISNPLPTAPRSPGRAISAVP